MKTTQQKTAFFVLIAGACVIFIGRFYHLGTFGTGWRSILVIAGVGSAAIILFWFVPEHRRKSTAIIMLGTLLVGRYWLGDGASYWQLMALIGLAIFICLIGALWLTAPAPQTPQTLNGRSSMKQLALIGGALVCLAGAVIVVMVYQPLSGAARQDDQVTITNETESFKVASAQLENNFLT